MWTHIVFFKWWLSILSPVTSKVEQLGVSEWKAPWTFGFSAVFVWSLQLCFHFILFYFKSLIFFFLFWFLVWVFSFVLFCFSKTGFLWRSTWLCLLHAGVKGTCRYHPPNSLIFLTILYLICCIGNCGDFVSDVHLKVPYPPVACHHIRTYIDTCRGIVGHILKSHRQYSVRMQVQKS